MLVKPLVRPICRPLTSAITAALGGFSPRSLFSAGEQGVIYDLSDSTTLFADSAGTTAAVVNGPVGLVLDKSGRGNHASQTTAPSRPTLRVDGNGLRYLEFDGVDDSLQTASINLTATDKMFVCAGVRKLSDSADGTVVELSASVSVNNGSFNINAPGSSAVTKFQYASRGTATSVPFTASATYNAPYSGIITCLSEIATDTAILRINGAQVNSQTTDQGTGNFGNYPLYIGRRGGTSLPFNGRLYGLIVRGAATDAAKVSATETWMNSRTRAY